MRRASGFISLLVLVLILNVSLGCSGTSGDDDDRGNYTTDDDAAADDDADDDNTTDCADQSNLGTDLNDTMENFTFTNENGDPLSLYDLCGRVVLIVSAAGWCSACGYEARNITNDIYNRYHDQGLEIYYTLFEDTNGNLPSQTYLSWYKKLYDLPFHLYADIAKHLFQYQDTYPMIYVPFHIILDKNMVIKYKMAGYDPNALRNYIEQLL